MKKLIIFFLLIAFACTPAYAEATADGSGIYDYAEVLTGDEAGELEILLQDCEERLRMTAAVLFVEDIQEKTPEAYADDFYDKNGLGVGSSNDGLLLLVSFAERDVYVSTCGEAILLFTDSDLDLMISEVAPYLTSGDYAGAVRRFAGFTEEHVTAVRAALDSPSEQNKTVTIDGIQRDVVPARNGEYVYFDEHGAARSYSSLPLRVRYSVFELLMFAVLIGLAAGGLTVVIMVIIHKASLSKAPDAQTYSDGFSLLRSTERFVRTHTTRTAIPQNDSSGTGGRGGFGGGSSHTSSGGISHGGHGGKF